METVENSLRADLLVIGFGKGGKIAAGTMARLGKRVVVVEQSPEMYGGTCPNVGCVPTKALVHRSRNRRPTDPPQEWYERAVGEVHAITSLFRKGNFDGMDGLETASVLTGHAEFTGPDTVVVDTADGPVTVRAEHILINTGSTPVIPDIPGLRASEYLVTSTDLIHRTELPKRLAIVGGGYLGIEFAAIYRRFGSEVTLFESTSRILDHLDDDVQGVAEKILVDEGIEIVTGANVTRVEDGAGEAIVRYMHDGRERTLAVDAVLAAAGRKPATDGLGIAAAGVRVTARGAVEVDEYLRTSRPHIFALGDVNGGPQFTYISLDDSRIVLDQLLGEGKRATTDRVAVPRTLFMTPPLAMVGLTEREARDAGHRIKVSSQAVADIIAMPRAYVVDETRGVMKFVIDLDTDEILGAALLSVDAQELINTVAQAMRHGITATQLGEAIYTHPSSTEAFNDVIAAVVRSDAE
ncbi:FAD-dependent oxidoreductase [Amycolatopsis rhabdoformis]|uniref:FAD-dependent oxidoreductase n=1 Tax=Amycolatopsis rhabdoformis TaxID=1448059 RepID=A0ABZ1IGW8_9PSEU|nr:FAD-dependent oxidoreductase [Amycolatopsis rhabdoformis]WSE32680.1 FAD-dependent oxidoreductase [Amycolatopsis rhabdoformis]